jgi:23S rRNA (cytidine1920-2'-O)/16S rRNA (cytidine1409-2'-O)-methyltransferase
MTSGNESGGRRRLDVELVQRGLAPTRARAREAIEAGKVHVDGVAATKPGQLVGDGSLIEAEAAHPWVSRGGLKLDHALTVFGVDPAGRHCLDIGSSTGGFTDVLLARGARRVVAVDVGVGQLHSRLRADLRVVSHEATDARNIDAAMVIEPPTLIVCDASFIGLAKLLTRPLELAAPQASLVALFKPQFEVGRSQVGTGGVVTDPQLRADAVLAVARRAAELGWHTVAATASPLPGPSGNVEYFLRLRAQTDGALDGSTHVASALDGEALDAEVRRAIAQGPQ